MIIKVQPDKQKTKSILKLIEQREKSLKVLRKTDFYTIIAEHYYEVIKELITSLLLLDGIKTTGENAHKELIECLRNYKEFSEEETSILDDLRIRRNKSSYEGKEFEGGYIKNKEQILNNIIRRLKILINNKLGS